MHWFVSILPAEHSSRESQSLSTVSLPCSLDHATLHISQWGFYGLFFGVRSRNSTRRSCRRHVMEQAIDIICESQPGIIGFAI